MADRYSSLTPEQIAEDFCATHPGKTAIVSKGNKTVIRDPAGNVHISVYNPFIPPVELASPGCPKCGGAIVGVTLNCVKCHNPDCDYEFCY